MKVLFKDIEIGKIYDVFAIVVDILPGKENL
jgi:hypothetical protein